MRWLACSVLALTGAGAAQLHGQSSMAARFVGTWRLVSTEQRLADGTIRAAPAYGPSGQGYLIYDSSGHMCALLMDPGRPRWQLATPSPEELRRAWDGLVAYCGTHEVDEREELVVHHVELDKSPNLIGTDRRRRYLFDGPRLTLQVLPPPEGVAEYRLTWERVTLAPR